MTDIGTLGGPQATAAAINNGEIVGIAQTSSDADHGFLYTGGSHHQTYRSPPTREENHIIGAIWEQEQPLHLNVPLLEASVSRDLRLSRHRCGQVRGQ